MKIKRLPVALAAIPLFLSLAGLCVPVFVIRRQDYRNLLVAEPPAPASPRIALSKIESFCTDEFLITYELSRTAKASQARAGSPVEVPVILIGTNDAWRAVMGFPLLDGAFFTKLAWEGKLRQAALNKEAARVIFGGVKAAGSRLRLNGETWIVTGVVDDGAAQCRVYAPSSAAGGTADTVSTIMALLDTAGGITEASAKNSLKSLGIHAKDVTFYNLETLSRLPGSRALAAFGAAALTLLLSAVPPLSKKAAARYRDLRAELKNRYLRELLSCRLPDLLRLAALTLALAAAAAAALFVALKLAALCLPWRGLPKIAALGAGSFSPKLAILKAVDPPSRILFWTSLGFTALFAWALRFKPAAARLPLNQREQ